MGRTAAFLVILTATAALAGCSTVGQILPLGTQTLTITPGGGAAYDGQCVVRGAEPVTVEGSTKESWTLGEGVDCRIVQKGSGTLTAELAGPGGLVSRSQSTGDGALLSIAQQ